MFEVKNVDYASECGLSAKSDSAMGEKRSTVYEVECYRDGEMLWKDTFHNLVTTAGLNDSLSKHFKASSYTAAWYVGLTTGSPTFAAGDVIGTHAGWTESTAYTESVRQTLTLGTPSSGSVDNSASKAVFTINASATVGGSFVVSDNTKGGTSTGIIYGGGAFTNGNRSLQSGDTLNITITLTAS
jgi:hypothetical protein